MLWPNTTSVGVVSTQGESGILHKKNRGDLNGFLPHKESGTKKNPIGRKGRIGLHALRSNECKGRFDAQTT